MPVSLTSAQIATIETPGTYRASDNLYLQVKNGGKSWILRYSRDGKARQMGLGPLKLVPLSKAKEKAQRAMVGLLDGVDPLAARKATRPAAQAAVGIPTFRECTARFIDAHEAGWKSPKHRDQWESTLKTYADPVIGHLLPSEVTVQHLVQILKPIWATKSETASRLRGRVEKVLGWAGA